MLNKSMFHKKYVGLGLLLLIVAILASVGLVSAQSSPDGAAPTNVSNDTIAPVTTISGVTENDSFDNSVTITLNATDNEGGSGVDQTFYKINGGENVTYTEPFNVTDVGHDNVTYWSTDKANNTESPNMVNFTIAGNETPAVPFEFTVVPQSTTVAPAENAIYDLKISNTGNSSDVYDLTVDNQNEANVALSMNNTSVDNVSLEALESANIVMTVNGAATGTFLVNVTATSRANTENKMTVNTSTIVSAVPIAPGVNAIRTIESQFIGPGESTNVTVNISSDITQALVLQETIPEGWNLTRISDDADSFRNNSINEWLWINVSSGVNNTVVYKLTASNIAVIGTYPINGSVINSTGMVAAVGGSDNVSISIIGFYRKLGNDPDKIDTSDVLQAIADWRSGIKPDGFASPITSQDLTALIEAWVMRE